MRLILPFMFLGWRSTNNWPDWNLLHQTTAAGKLHGTGGWIQPKAGSLEAWNFGAVSLQWYSPNLLSFRGPRSQMKPEEFGKLFKSTTKPKSCNITTPVYITGLQGRFLLENTVLLLLKESGPHGGSASDLQLGLDFLACLWFASMFKRVWHAVKSATSAAFWFLPVNQGN